MLDQLAANTLPPKLWLYEERIQLRIPVLARKNGRKSFDRTGYLCNEDTAAFDLLKRKLNGVWVYQKNFTVARIVE